KIALQINGARHQVDVEPRTTLLDALRDQLGLTGPKQICDRGACGGCTVLMDNRSVCSCMMLAVETQGHSITTIEGIAADPVAAPLIDSFCTHDGAQCGFCIPGIVTRSKAMLDENPAPDAQAIRAGLAGNICRCGTYTKIFDSILAASGQPVA